MSLRFLRAAKVVWLVSVEPRKNSWPAGTRKKRRTSFPNFPPAVIYLWTLIFLSLSAQNQACECGRTPTNRILRGTPVRSGEFPWMGRVLIQISSHTHLCGASLISPDYVVTAGHCLTQGRSNWNFLVPQTTYVQFRNPLARGGFTTVTVTPVALKGTRKSEDIAVLKLSQPVYAEPICLPPSGKTYAGDKATFLGYGETENADFSNTLLSGQVTVPTNAQCSLAHRGRADSLMNSNDICAGNFGGVPAVCKGDSGGPLMYYDTQKNVWELIGVAHGTYHCRSTSTYAVFTRVSGYVPWIQEVTGNAGCVK